jgi:hypothetical protein
VKRSKHTSIVRYGGGRALKPGTEWRTIWSGGSHSMLGSKTASGFAKIQQVAISALPDAHSPNDDAGSFSPRHTGASEEEQFATTALLKHAPSQAALGTSSSLSSEPWPPSLIW